MTNQWHKIRPRNRYLPLLVSNAIVLVLTCLLLAEHGADRATLIATPTLLMLLSIPLYIGRSKPLLQEPLDTPQPESPIELIQKTFQTFPWTVEIYDKQGTLTWSNDPHNPFKKNLEMGSGTFNILKTPELKNSEFISQLQRALSGQTTSLIACDYHTMATKGEYPYKYYETTLTPLYDSHSMVCAVMVINRNIISGNATINENDNSTSPNGSEASEAFLRNVSHELRTPLNWIVGFSSLLANEQDIMKIKEYNYHIIKGGKLMLSSIEMLIDMSRIVKNEVSVIRTEFPVNRVLNEISSLLREDLKQMKYNITFKLNSFLNGNADNYLIVSDEAKLKKILNCMIHNSLKFTREGFIELGCVRLPEQTLLFYVKDTGIGISKDIQEYIFDAFRKGSSGIQDGLSGQGLGLSIAKNYVKLLGGDIWLDSESGKGTTLFFTIKDYSERKNDHKSVLKNDQVKQILKNSYITNRM
jgi:nitrogen-specific signal transduction histidine kinase